MKLELKSSKTFSDKSGSLVPFYKKESLANFNINRFFYIYGNQKYSRADHAHKQCNQILIPISGKIEVEVTNKKKIQKNELVRLHIVQQSDKKEHRKERFIKELCDRKCY